MAFFICIDITIFPLTVVCLIAYKIASVRYQNTIFIKVVTIYKTLFVFNLHNSFYQFFSILIKEGLSICIRIPSLCRNRSFIRICICFLAVRDILFSCLRCAFCICFRLFLILLRFPGSFGFVPCIFLFFLHSVYRSLNFLTVFFYRICRLFHLFCYHVLFLWSYCRICCHCRCNRADRHRCHTKQCTYFLFFHMYFLPHVKLYFLHCTFSHYTLQDVSLFVSVFFILFVIFDISEIKLLYLSENISSTVSSTYCNEK